MSMSTPQYPGYAPAATAKTNTLAIIALVASFFISIVGIVLGHVALNQIKTTGEGGRGLAIAALVIGYLSVAVGVIVVFIVIGAAAANR
jgi:peptidyl-prolyl cis-trans isomerase B (cyclophilin B)